MTVKSKSSLPDIYLQAAEAASEQVHLSRDQTARVAEAVHFIDDCPEGVFSPDQCLALAVHLAAYLKRHESNECIPPIDSKVRQEISAEAMSRSRNALKNLTGTDPSIDETALVAVHRDAATIIARSSS